MTIELGGASTDFLVSNLSMGELVARLIISVLLGALVGFERQLSNKPAGIRTHMLVSLGACLFTVIAISNFKGDAGRILGGLVTGIGFIGAGNIIANRGKVHGITTAATLWTVAAIGLAVGSGSYFLAVISGVLVFMILQFKRIEKHF